MKTSTRLSLFGMLIFLSFAASAQNNFWKKTTETSLKILCRSQKPLLEPSSFKSFTLDTTSLKSYLKGAPKEFTPAARQGSFIFAIPMPDGSFSSFTVAETSVMEPGLAAKYPEIKVYSGTGITDPTAIAKLSWTYTGFSAIIYSSKGTISVSPYTAGSKTAYICYDTKNIPAEAYTEANIDHIAKNINAQIKVAGALNAQAAPCTGTQLFTYRFALSCTGEFAQALGYGAAITKAQVLSDFTNRTMAFNAIFENETAIRFLLISNTDKLIFLDPGTDPYANQYNNGALLSENQQAVDNLIGTPNYDFGINLNSSGSGVARVNSICVSTIKAMANSGYGDILNPHYIESICHEIGHQFSCPHSYNCGTSGGVEPGTGVTIMTYAGAAGGGCSAILPYDIPYFHTASRTLIYNYSRLGNGNNCPGIINTGNTPPVVTLPATAYTIPLSTPFIMTGKGTDADGDALNYQWEENDQGASNSSADWNNPTGTDPLFKDFIPTPFPIRSFPQVSDVLSGVATVGEFMANYARTINLRLTAKDNKTGVCSADALVTVTNMPAFRVTSQSTTETWVANGTNTATITWTTGTNVAPYNSPTVDILFSTDGGLSFPYTLVTGTPNDGTEAITVPAYNGVTKGRVMVRSVGNVFYNINKSTIAIQSAACGAEGAVIGDDTAISALAGSPILNLSLAPVYTTGITFTSVSGNFNLSDPFSDGSYVLDDGTPACGNSFRYRAWKICVSKTGSYTFNRTGDWNLLNLFAGAFDPSNGCNNLLNASFVANGPRYGNQSSITQTLTAGLQYILVSQWRDAGAPNDYNNSITSQPAGSTVYFGSSIYTDAGAAYKYKYLIVNAATNKITGIATTADLSNSDIYQDGNYTVYGLSYGNSISDATLNNYIGTAFSSFTSQIASGNICANLSKNTVPVNILPKYYTFTNPGTIISCTGVNAQTNLALTRINGFASPITLSAFSLPAGTTAVFGNNPLNPGDLTTVTLQGSTLPTGDYQLGISGTDGVNIKTTTLNLKVPPPLGTSTLSSPLKNSIGQSVQPIFVWAPIADAANYTLDISQDQTFTTGITSITGITSTTYTLTNSLAYDNRYYWRVTAVNTCGSGPATQPNLFRTYAIQCNPVVTSTDVPKATPTGAYVVTTTSSSLTIPAGTGGIISDVDVIGMKGNNNYIADLSFFLISPAPVKTATLIARKGNVYYTTFNINFDDDAPISSIPTPQPPDGTPSMGDGLTVKPEQPLAKFNGQNNEGTWLLSITNSGGVNPGNLTGWGLRFCYQAATPLPINWLSFTAIKAANNSVQLVWQTANEINNDHYEVERSSDGVSFSYLNTVKAGTNATMVQVYYLYDLVPFGGSNYYRLKQVDIDGKFVYSKIVIVAMNKEVLYWSISPNPAVDYTILKAMGLLTNVSIRLTDAVGKLIWSQKIDFLQALETIKVPLGNIAGGVYTVTLISDQYKRSVRILKQ